jgi:hypothetical protein
MRRLSPIAATGTAQREFAKPQRTNCLPPQLMFSASSRIKIAGFERDVKSTGRRVEEISNNGFARNSISAHSFPFSLDNAVQ